MRVLVRSRNLEGSRRDDWSSTILRGLRTYSLLLIVLVSFPAHAKLRVDAAALSSTCTGGDLQSGTCSTTSTRDIGDDTSRGMEETVPGSVDKNADSIFRNSSCSIVIGKGGKPEAATFRVRPRDPFALRYLQALRFARDHSLWQGYGCDSSQCVAQHLVEAVDQGLCAKLQRDNVLFVPIGETCGVTLSLRTFGARLTAFPFDWTLQPMESIVAMLRSNFSSLASSTFLQSEELRFGSLESAYASHSENKFTPAIDDATGAIFLHDFPLVCNRSAAPAVATSVPTVDDPRQPCNSPNDPRQHEIGAMDTIDQVRAKYERRIQRLQRLLAQDDVHIFLVTMPAEKAILKSQRPVFDEFGVDTKVAFSPDRFDRARESLVNYFAPRSNVHVVGDMEASDVLAGINGGPLVRLA